MRHAAIAFASAALVALVAAPAPAHEPALSPEAQLVHDFEERYGFRNVFWCADNAAGMADALSRAASGSTLPAIAFEAPLYCRARHFPTADDAACEQSVDAVIRLDAVIPGFKGSELARGIAEACGTIVI
ncbi:hypothetical protein [Salinarimonas ramus]|uniref:Uncharacterized protein n=1 Tax=Salinarimonas ramus TaxID=690164 RepID=A0A917Q854_9HYPH|nr:hypothetical protein [Salinarimonas ramus]GGK35033.1 hypothetical protein GCM10011322_22280 [Salinarimonas ramus]